MYSWTALVCSDLLNNPVMFKVAGQGPGAPAYEASELSEIVSK